ncbi:hypothetical protein [Glutamicibacter sp. TV12E]|uniref:hypothetical protein n=1 Tax=Glutamicibacter sp. TV12E TaxID=3446362 RepID=UPI00403391CD
MINYFANLRLKKAEHKHASEMWAKENEKQHEVWLRNQDKEHQIWLRDLKLKTYSETLTYYKELETSIGVPKTNEAEYNAKHIAALSSTDTQIELFGSLEVQVAYDEVRAAFMSTVRTKGETRPVLNQKIRDLAGIMRNEIEATPSEN